MSMRGKQRRIQRTSLVVLAIVLGVVVTTVVPQSSVAVDDPGTVRRPRATTDMDPARLPNLNLLLEPVAGLTTTTHVAPDEAGIPIGTALRFSQAVSNGTEIEWVGAESVSRTRTQSTAVYQPTSLGEFLVQSNLIDSSGTVLHTNYCLLNVLDISVDEIRIRPILPVVAAFHVDADDAYEVSHDYFFGESIAAIIEEAVEVERPLYKSGKVDRRKSVAPASTRWTTSIGRRVTLDPRVGKPKYAIPMEWRLPDGSVRFASTIERTFTEPGIYVFAFGPIDRPARIEIEAYSVSITSHVSNSDIIPEGELITFTAETDPPGFEDDITWLSSTKYGIGTPVLGYGSTFLVQFDDAFGRDDDGTPFLWLGVKADNAVFNQDQKPGFLKLLSPREGHIVGGDNVLIWAAVRENSEEAIVRPTLELSLDGTNYDPLLQQLAPDFGAGSTTTTIDAESLPSGPAFIRASAKDQQVVHAITVNHLPQVTCTASGLGKEIDFDCSQSSDSDGIAQYDWSFGDGMIEQTTIATNSHTYSTSGEYDLWVTATDNLGLPSTAEYKLVVLQDVEVALAQHESCECKKMTINIAGDSFVRDPRRLNDNGTPADSSDDTYDPGPLGRDPKFVSFNFEVFASVNGDATLCEQGQEVKRTAKYGAGAEVHKKACKGGRTLAICKVNADCHTFTCSGGTENGKSCLGATLRGVCLLGGGTCPASPGGDGNGNCSERKFTGGVRGNDDYTKPSPGDLFVKIRCPVCSTPFWFDGPGLGRTEHATATKDFRYDADFVAFMRGSGEEKDCSCHFKVVIDWDGANQVYRGATGLTLIMDGETVNCNLDDTP